MFPTELIQLRKSFGGKAFEDMRMHNEEGTDSGKPHENGEPMKLGVEETPDISINQKYKDLKSKLKYLIYVRCDILTVATVWSLLENPLIMIALCWIILFF